jgi:hypothetical protein
MNGDSVEARIAVLENQLARDKEERDHRRKELDDRLEELTASVQSLSKEIGRYKGFVGGVSLMASILWAGVAFFKEQIIKALS